MPILGLLNWAISKYEYTPYIRSIRESKNIKNASDDIIMFLGTNEYANSLKEKILELRESIKKIKYKESILYKEMQEEEAYYFDLLMGLIETLSYEYVGEISYELNEYDKLKIANRFIGLSDFIGVYLFGY